MGLSSAFSPRLSCRNFEAFPVRTASSPAGSIRRLPRCSHPSGVRTAKAAGVLQYYKRIRCGPDGPGVERAITRNPCNHYSPDLSESDRLQTLYRPLNEYCEPLDASTQHIIKVSFSTEPPEHWRAMFGDGIFIDNTNPVKLEFLMAPWVNDPARRKTPSGNDVFIARNAASRQILRRCPIFGKSRLYQAQVSAQTQRPLRAGGGYFFMPALSVAGSNRRTSLCLSN
jgi:hypothetical protein